MADALRKTVKVTQEVTVEVDESKFTPEWMAEFRSYMFPFHDIDDHIKHLAQLYARGVADDTSFIEGYGPAKEMGIRFTEGEMSEEIENG